MQLMPDHPNKIDIIGDTHNTNFAKSVLQSTGRLAGLYPQARMIWQQPDIGA